MILTLVFGVLGILSFLYYIGIVLYAGIGIAFSFIWVVIGGLSIILSGIMYQTHNGGIKVPAVIQKSFFIFLVVGVIFFLLVVTTIIKGAISKPQPNAHYMIILGAKVNGRQPSKTLRARVRAAADYLQENKQTIVIVSGGQGPGEDITEAEAMASLLQEYGIEKSRIRLEDKSTDTKENIEFSQTFITKKEDSVVIATSDFHVYRGMKMARKQGFTNVSPCPSKSDPVLFVHYYLREFFAVVKDTVKGNI